MADLKTHPKLEFPGMPEYRYQVYRAQLIASEQDSIKALKAAKRELAKPRPLK